MTQAARKLTLEPRLATRPAPVGVSDQSSTDDDQRRRAERSSELLKIEREMLRNNDALSALAGLLEGSEAATNGALVLDELSGLVAVVADAVRRTNDRACALF